MNTSLWFPILDRRLLAESLQDSIGQRYGGRLAAAAKDVGLQRLTLRRLVNRQAKRVKAPTLMAILKLLPVSSPGERAFILPAHVRALELHSDWAIAYTSHIAQGNPVARLSTIETPRGWKASRKDDVDVLIERLRTVARHVAEQLRRGLAPAPGKSVAHSMFRKLGGTADAAKGRYLRGIHPARYLLSVYRLIQPLLDSQGFGGIERHHSELSDVEFQRFVEAGWVREEILLTRESDQLRVQRPAAALSARLTYRLSQRTRLAKGE